MSQDPISPAFVRSPLSAAVRRALSVEPRDPENPGSSVLRSVMAPRIDSRGVLAPPNRSGTFRPYQPALEPHEAQFRAALENARAPEQGKSLTPTQVQRARELIATEPERFGIPRKDDTQYVFMSANVRKLGDVRKKTAGAWQILADVFRQSEPDIFNVQEVMDSTEGLELLKTALGPHYDMIYTDTTGGDERLMPDGRVRRVGMKERLATLFDTRSVERGQMAADLSFDRSAVVDAMVRNQHRLVEALADHLAAISQWSADGSDGTSPPKYEFPDFFIDFTRTPSVYELVLKGEGEAREKFLVVNAHMVFGDYSQRVEELQAFLQSAMGLAARGHNVLVGGDFNLKLRSDKADRDLERIEGRLRALGDEASAKNGVEMNFPFLGPHPERGLQTTNLRASLTYDHIGMLSQSGAFPGEAENATAGSGDYDFGVVRLDELFAEVMFDKPFGALSKDEKKELYRRTEHDITDHLPIWIRAQKPAEVTGSV